MNTCTTSVPPLAAEIDRLSARNRTLLAALTRLLESVEPDKTRKWAEGSEVEQARVALANPEIL